MNTITTPFAWKFVAEASESVFVKELGKLRVAISETLAKDCRFVTGLTHDVEEAESYIHRGAEQIRTKKDGRLPALTFVLVGKPLNPTGLIVTFSWTAIPYLELAQQQGSAAAPSELVDTLMSSAVLSHAHTGGKWKGKPAETYVQLKSVASTKVWNLVHRDFSNTSSLIDFEEWNRVLNGRFPGTTEILDTKTSEYIQDVERILGIRNILVR